MEDGEPQDEIQVGFVVGDLIQLARVPADDTLAEDILITLVDEVYRNEAPRNRPGAPKHEPRLSHLVDYLGTWPFKGASASRAEELKLALGQYCGHSFLDAPTHPDFAGESALDVYELDSLEQFPERVRESLAYRAAARVLRAIGKLNEDGTRSPTLLVFDEVWKIREKYPRILDVIKRGARTGGKENVVSGGGSDQRHSQRPRLARAVPAHARFGRRQDRADDSMRSIARGIVDLHDQPRRAQRPGPRPIAQPRLVARGGHRLAQPALPARTHRSRSHPH